MKRNKKLLLTLLAVPTLAISLGILGAVCYYLGLLMKYTFDIQGCVNPIGIGITGLILTGLISVGAYFVYLILKLLKDG